MGIFDWFRKDEPPQVFADNREAFDYACEYLPNRVLIEAVIPALVEEEGKRGPDGEHMFLIRLAGPGGGRELWAPTLAEATEWPLVGDLVGFRVVTIADDLPPELAVIGYIACTFAPVLAGRKGWRVAKNLTPDTIKPTVRF
jgi:hypothetical protein